MTNKQVTVVTAEVVWSAFAPVTRCSEAAGSLLSQRVCLVYGVSCCEGIEVLQVQGVCESFTLWFVE